jgi:hypothetical protein
MRTYAIATGRRYERKPANNPATIIVGCNGNKSEHQAYLVEISQRGLRLRVDASLTPGQIVLVMSGDRPKSAVRGRVAWAREPKSGRQWEAGLELLQPLAEVA